LVVVENAPQVDGCAIAREIGNRAHKAAAGIDFGYVVTAFADAAGDAGQTGFDIAHGEIQQVDGISTDACAFDGAKMGRSGQSRFEGKRFLIADELVDPGQSHSCGRARGSVRGKRRNAACYFIHIDEVDRTRDRTDMAEGIRRFANAIGASDQPEVGRGLDTVNPALS
jgi:hypothetical protein